jgi:hypothetical protein
MPRCCLIIRRPQFLLTCVQGVRMKGIQNKIIMSQKAFLARIYGLHHYKGKLSNFFSEYITLTIHFNVGSLVGTIIQTIFDLVPRCLKRVWYYRSHSVPYAGFQVLEVVDRNLIDNVLHITSQEKIQWC